MSDYAKQFHVREWINGLRDDDLHDIGRAWDAAFRERGPGRMKAEASVRAALFRYAPEWGRLSNASPPLALTQARAAQLVRQTVCQCDHVGATDKLGWGDVCEFCARVVAGILGYHDEGGK